MFGSSFKFNTNTTIKFSPQVFRIYHASRPDEALGSRRMLNVACRLRIEHHGMSLHTIGPSAAGTRHRSKDVHISSRTANATMIAPSTTCDTCQLERAAGTSDPPRCSKSAGLCAVHRASPLIPRACCADLDSRDGWLLRREPIAAGCSRHLSHPHPTAGHIG